MVLAVVTLTSTTMIHKQQQQWDEQQHRLMKVQSMETHRQCLR
jgi:hypothetical protein